MNNIEQIQSTRAAIARRAQIETDISAHLLRIFDETVSVSPKLIVELGTRGGESTQVFWQVAQISGAEFVSCDMDDCRNVLPPEAKWRFVQSDDISFAKRFEAWRRQERLPEKIDLLFIDTSHEYWQTKREIANWFKFLSPKGKVIFHDTNCGWNNWRGVIRAIEQAIGTRFDEHYDFTMTYGRWNIKHFAESNGLTILIPNLAKPSKRYGLNALLFDSKVILKAILRLPASFTGR